MVIMLSAKFRFYVVQGFIHAKRPDTEIKMLYAVCMNLDIDHSLLDIGYSLFLIETWMNIAATCHGEAGNAETEAA